MCGIGVWEWMLVVLGVVFIGLFLPTAVRSRRMHKESVANIGLPDNAFERRLKLGIPERVPALKGP